MKINTLNKALTAIMMTAVASSVSTVAMANTLNNTAMTTGQITERTGESLTKLTDATYTRLTGKTVSSVEVNHPVSLYDHEQASSSYEDAYFTGSLNVKDSKDTSTSYDVNVGVDYENVMSTPDANIKYEADLSGIFSDDGNDDTDKVENFSGRVSTNYDRYFNAQTSDAFWYGKGEARVQQEEYEGYAGLENPELTLSAGLGYGRVVNVTSMAQTMRLVEALTENGTLSGTPSAAQYKKISEIISLQDVYRNENPAKYVQAWMADIENALGINLGAAGTIKAYEVLTQENISTRKYGWDVRAGAGLVATNFAGDSSKPLLELQANYYLPVSNKTQFSNEARVSAQLDDDNDSYTFANDMGLTYELNDRVDWENKWNLSYDRNDGAADLLRNTLSSAFLYEVSNSLDYETRINVTHTDAEGADSSLDKGLFMGVKYRMK